MHISVSTQFIIIVACVLYGIGAIYNWVSYCEKYFAGLDFYFQKHILFVGGYATEAILKFLAYLGAFLLAIAVSIFWLPVNLILLALAYIYGRRRASRRRRQAV